MGGPVETKGQLAVKDARASNSKLYLKLLDNVRYTLAWRSLKCEHRVVAIEAGETGAVAVELLVVESVCRLVSHRKQFGP